MIRLNNVSKRYRVYDRPRHFLSEKITRKKQHRAITALEDINLTVNPGECLGVVGVNGSGKSTLLRVMAGISPPTSGSVDVEGRVSALLELDSGFHPEFTGRENIRIGSAILGLSREEARQNEEKIIEFSELGDFIDVPVRTYSAGMYLRLGFALATAVDPQVLLVDEALAVGDEWFRGKCTDRIMAIRESGATIVIVSHDLTMVRALCDKAALLKDHRVHAFGEPPEVVSHYLTSIYEQAVAEAGETSLENRRGTGDAAISAVRLMGPDNHKTDLVKAGEPVTVEFDYHARQEIQKPLFGVNIFRADGILAVCANNETASDLNQKLYPAEDPGDRPDSVPAGHSGTARFMVYTNTLLEGEYELSVNIYRGRSGAHVLVEEVLGALRFRVVGGELADRGMVLLPGRWKIS
ncbi:MAG: ABC transporter ATP-binding protein [bacterium]